nr:MAG TPA: hypothetical protein [Caudoviricetes sp.]
MSSEGCTGKSLCFSSASKRSRIKRKSRFKINHILSCKGL